MHAVAMKLGYKQRREMADSLFVVRRIQEDYREKVGNVL